RFRSSCMNTWSNGAFIVEQLDRQFEFLRAAKGTKQITRLSRVLNFIKEDPQLAAILYDLRLEAEQRTAELSSADAAVRRELAAWWAAYGAKIQQRLAGIEDDALHVYGNFDGYDKKVIASRNLDLAKSHHSDGETKSLVSQLQHWRKWANDIASPVDS